MKTKSKTITKQPPVDERTAELQAKYSHRFRARPAGNRTGHEPAQVETAWAGQHMRTAADYAKGADRYPAGYVQRPKERITDLAPSQLDRARLNVASMRLSGLTPAAISDVLRIVLEDVAAELKRQRREGL